jgi:phage gp36-like protein
MSYATSTDLSTRFGLPNIQKWADLEGDASGIAARIAAALTFADSQINMSLRGGGYSVPVISATTDVQYQITDWATVIAAHWLYASRGLLDEDKQVHKLEKLYEQVETKLAAIRAGKWRLDIRKWAPNPNAPACITN